MVEASGGTTTAVYFSGAAAVEERIGTFGYHNILGATGQTVLRDVFSDINLPGGATPDWRTYAQQNAVGDVVALIGHGAAVGNVVERYAYAPYGSVSILDAAGSPKTSSPYQWRQLFQGGRFDATTGLYLFGFRDYDPATGVWMQRDPIGLAGGDVNLYRFTGNNPIVRIDPSGLDWLDSYFPGYGWMDSLFNAYQRYGSTAGDPIPGAATGPKPIAPLSPEDPGVFTSNSIQLRGPESQKVPSTTAGRNVVETLKSLAAKGVVDGAMELGASGVGKLGGKVLDDLVPCPPANRQLSGPPALRQLPKPIVRSSFMTGISRQVSRQKQYRHIKGRPEVGTGSYMNSLEDAQRVLDAAHSGKATVLGKTGNGHIIVEFPDVTGCNNNPGAGLFNQQASIFTIKGTTSPSVVPASPTLRP